MGVDPGTDASTEELAERFDKVHEHTSHGEHEGEPDPATGANYDKDADSRGGHVDHDQDSNADEPIDR